MRFTTLILLLFLTLSVFAADVVFKTEKEVKTENRTAVIIGEFETGKYKTLRVAVSAGTLEKDIASISIESVEGSEVYKVESFVLNSNSSNSKIISVVGKRLRVTANESSKYKLIVWGE